MSIDQRDHCPDCDGQFSRRDFLWKAGATSLAAAAAGALPLFAEPRHATAAAKAAKSETLVAQLYQTLTEEQKSKIWFPFDHPKRSMVNNNWHIVPQKIGEFFTKEQIELNRVIFDGLHSEEYRGKIQKQLQDDSGGFNNYSVAMFGKPGEGKFEWVLTGRHMTARADGDSLEGACFGGPIFYGHAAQGFNEKPDHPGNIYWYQALRANELFQMLDGKQREQATVADSPAENPNLVKITGKLTGIPVADLSKDQKAHVRKVLADLLAPFRALDVKEVMKAIERNGGLDSLAMSFYTDDDVGNDKVWDNWRIEGPSMVWFFRGHPHVHTWVHVRTSV